LRIARLEAGVAQSDAKFAGLWLDPSLSLNLLKIQESIPHPWYINPTLTFTIPLSGRLKIARNRADAELKAELDRVYETERQVVLQLRDSWMSWSALKKKLDQTRKALQELNSLAQTTTRLTELGEMPVTESRLFLMEREIQREQMIALENQSRKESIRIRSLMGLTPDAPLDLKEHLNHRTNEPEYTNWADRNPTLARLRSEHEVAEKTLQLEIRKQYPDLNIGPQAESDAGQSRIGLGGTLPLPVLNANRGSIASARVKRDLARAIYETEYERLNSELVSLQSDLENNHSRLEILDSTLIPLTDQQMQDAYRLMEIGEADGLTMLESLTRSIGVRHRIIDIHLALSHTRNAIDYLTETPEYRIDTQTLQSTK
jgi:outer membrane protein, heavy metal efflux system